MLNDADRAILHFERTWWLQPGPKDAAIEFSLGMGAADYYEALLSLIDRRETWEHDPLTVKRVRSFIEPPCVAEVAG